MNGRTVVVSRGIGGVELPIRLFAPPDALVFECASAEVGEPLRDGSAD